MPSLWVSVGLCALSVCYISLENYCGVTKSYFPFSEMPASQKEVLVSPASQLWVYGCWSWQGLSTDQWPRHEQLHAFHVIFVCSLTDWPIFFFNVCTWILLLVKRPPQLKTFGKARGGEVPLHSSSFLAQLACWPGLRRQSDEMKYKTCCVFKCGKDEKGVPRVVCESILVMVLHAALPS